jgi:hypothetical protein
MKKQLILSVLLAIIVVYCFGQDVKKTVPAIETKMDRFTSKTGTFSKFIDSKLPVLKISYGSAETRIRKLISGTEAIYFYQIEKSGQYNSTTASIEYTDLLEVIKALNALKTEADKDIALNPDYLENKFITVDGFQVGYFIDKGKSTWYVKLEKYGSENTLFIKDEMTLEAAFNDAKAKIEELKK